MAQPFFDANTFSITPPVVGGQGGPSTTEDSLRDMKSLFGNAFLLPEAPAARWKPKNKADGSANGKTTEAAGEDEDILEVSSDDDAPDRSHKNGADVDNEDGETQAGAEEKKKKKNRRKKRTRKQKQLLLQ